MAVLIKMDYLSEVPREGFNAELQSRNEHLLKQGLKPGSYTKTGTTIVGAIYDKGVILGADTRATSGETVLEKNCRKLHWMAPNIYCAGAGTAADCEHVTLQTASQLHLLRLHTHTETRVVTVVALLNELLFKYGGHVGAHLIAAGVDITGPQLFMIGADGNYRHLPYTSMGSGSVAAIPVLDATYRDGMTREEAIAMVVQAIEAGIKFDNGSGSNVDYVTIEAGGKVDYQRNFRFYNRKVYETTQPYVFPAGTTRKF